MPVHPIPSTFLAATAVTASLLAITAVPSAAAPPPATSAATAPAATADAGVQEPVTAELDATDPTAQSNPGGTDSNGNCFPGCRGVDQLIAYTPAYGERTGTNEYGTEAVVEDGRVTTVGGGDSRIPANGLVLSGHGAMARWISTHAVTGTKVDIDGGSVTLTFDAEAHIVRAEMARDQALTRRTSATESCTVFPEPQVSSRLADATAHTTAARDALRDGRTSEAIALAGKALTAATGAADLTRESRPVEGRGVWVRPTETTPQAIRKTLDRIEHAGFNMVFLETVWQGYTIFPSDAARNAGITPQRPGMEGFDPLKVWIDEAHERGIEMHAWVHTFFVGSDGAGGPGATPGPGPILEKYPQWAAVEREDVGAQGPRPSSKEPGYYFVDPAMPGPRAYIRSVFEELITDYAIDGLHLDYIRYPVSLPHQASFSYSDYSREQFAKEHGVDPYTLAPGDPQWEDWNAWRENNVTTFVQSVREMQQQLNPGLALSAAVFADPVDGLKKKFQNWAAWVDAGYLDILTGMSFGSSPGSVADDTQVMRDRVGDTYLYTATYGPFNGSPTPLMGDQLQAVNNADSDGTALFAYNQLTDTMVTALHNGAYRTPATAPHHAPAEATRRALGPLRARIDAAGGTCVRDGDAARVTARLKAAEELLEYAGEHGPAPARRHIEAAHAAAERWEEAEPAFAATVTRDLRMLGRWLDHLDR